MVTINMLVCGSGRILTESIKKEIGIFEKKFPNLKIEINIIPWQDAWENIVTAANEQRGPDILHIGSTWNATLS